MKGGKKLKVIPKARRMDQNHCEKDADEIRKGTKRTKRNVLKV